MRTLAPLAFALFVLLGSAADGAADTSVEQAARLHAEAESLLRQGEVEAAAKGFLQAARLVPKNAAYVERAMMLRRVVSLRRYVTANPTSPRAEQAILSLHSFYLQNELPRLARAQAMTAHDRTNSATSAGLLAEAHLELGENVEAANLLAEHSACSPELALLHAIALARLGRADAARAVAGPDLPSDATPGRLYDAARLHALLGETEEALARLRLCFERTPAAGLAVVKQRVRTGRDFVALADLPAFAEVLRTTSQVRQTCSGGKDCGSCPLRGRCGGGPR